MATASETPRIALAPSLRLVRRAVELDHGLVDLDLVLGLEAGDRVENVAVDRFDRLQDALAAVAALVAVAQFDRLVRAGRSARGHGGAAHRAVLERDVDLDGGIAAAVENFARGDVDDGGHVGSVPWLKPPPIAAPRERGAVYDIDAPGESAQTNGCENFCLKVLGKWTKLLPTAKKMHGSAA